MEPVVLLFSSQDIKTLHLFHMFQLGGPAELKHPPAQVELPSGSKQTSSVMETGAAGVSVELFLPGGLNEHIDYYPWAL